MMMRLFAGNGAADHKCTGPIHFGSVLPES